MNKIFIATLAFVLIQLTACSEKDAITKTKEENSIATEESKNEDISESDTTDYFEIATYNIEWLGVPSKAGLQISRDEQLDKAVQDILDTDADIYALQEVIIDSLNGNALEDLVQKLNDIEGNEKWEGVYNSYFSYWWSPNFEDFPAQRQAFLYRKDALSNVQIIRQQGIEEDRRFASGRLPFILTTNVKNNDITQHILFVNLHLKCCKGHSDRRKNSMEWLLDYLNQNNSDENVVILGDLNVADAGGATGEIATWGTYGDKNNDNIPDYLHAGGAVEDLSYADIDHILISDELEDEYFNAPENTRNQILETSVSDHAPVKVKLRFQ